jgi:hypothetical protein
MTKYNDSFIYLEDELKVRINEYPTLESDTANQYNFNGPIKYVYSAKMVLGSLTLYRVDTVIY